MTSDPYHCMLDLETLGTSPGSVIVAIGACIIAADGQIQSGFYRLISPASGEKIGLRIDSSTVLWWLAQSDLARSELTDPTRQVPLLDALADFATWLPSHLPLWGNGADFDNALLQAAYQAAGQTAPWTHRQNRCYRTLKAIRPEIPRLYDQPIAHHALHDAKSQARHLIQLLA